VLTILALPFILITLGLFLFVVNSIIFELAAAIVPGFRLRYGFWSSTMGSLALAVINSILMAIVPPII
jgi:putative membrane protein